MGRKEDLWDAGYDSSGGFRRGRVAYKEVRASNPWLGVAASARALTREAVSRGPVSYQIVYARPSGWKEEQVVSLGLGQ